MLRASGAGTVVFPELTSRLYFLRRGTAHGIRPGLVGCKLTGGAKKSSSNLSSIIPGALIAAEGPRPSTIGDTTSAKVIVPRRRLATQARLPPLTAITDNVKQPREKELKQREQDSNHTASNTPGFNTDVSSSWGCLLFSAKL